MRRNKPKKKPHIGRPALGQEAKKVLVALRLSPIELARLRSEAKTAGVSLSAFIMAPHRKGKE